jgi:hypothetical protein
MIFKKACSSPEVAHDRKLESTSYTVSVNGGNDWLRQLHFRRSLINDHSSDRKLVPTTDNLSR